MVEDLSEEEQKLYFKMIGQDKDEEQLYVPFADLSNFFSETKNVVSK